MRCPICENEGRFNLIEIWKGYNLYHCSACDIIFSDPMKNPGSEWYGDCLYYDMNRNLCKLEWNHRLFLRETKLGSRLLDIGCGTGVFLKAAQEKGYKVYGIDFDKKSIAVAQTEHNLPNVYAISLEDFVSSYEGPRFDVITSFEVLEHQEDPNRFMAAVNSLLVAGGFIALSLPNRRRFVDPIVKGGDYPPHHLTRWDSLSISYFLNKHGYVIKELKDNFSAEQIAIALSALIKTGVTRRMLKKGSKKIEDIKLRERARQLLIFKDRLFTFASKPLAFISFLFGIQGIGIYCLARRK